jgi:Zn-dependent protease with chaperone function
MQYTDITLHIEGSSVETPVTVLTDVNQLILYSRDDGSFVGSFSLDNIYYRIVSNHFIVYLDKAGIKYLKTSSDNPFRFCIWNSLKKRGSLRSPRFLSQRTIVLLLLGLLLMVGGYFALVRAISFFGMKLISVDTEIRIGNQLRDAMMKEGSLYGERVDEEGSRKLQAFADRLELSTNYPVRLTLVKSDVVNAYALPGGQVVVYQGILDKINTPEQLAALLAHETTHVNERHTLRSMLRHAAHGIILSVLLGDASGVSGVLASRAGSLEGLRYSRTLEKEADNKGMELLLDNDISPAGMLELMQMLERQGDIPGSLSFLSSHPMTKERVKEARRFMRDHPKQEKQREDLKQVFASLKTVPNSKW